MKPIEILTDMSTIIVVGGINWFLTTVVIPTFNFDIITETITECITLLTSILLIVYMFFRCRKMFWDSETSKKDAKKK